MCLDTGHVFRKEGTKKYFELMEPFERNGSTLQFFGYKFFRCGSRNRLYFYLPFTGTRDEKIYVKKKKWITSDEIQKEMGEKRYISLDENQLKTIRFFHWGYYRYPKGFHIFSSYDECVYLLSIWGASSLLSSGTAKIVKVQFENVVAKGHEIGETPNKRNPPLDTAVAKRMKVIEVFD